jgi:hypothetical protein
LACHSARREFQEEMGFHASEEFLELEVDQTEERQVCGRMGI